MRWRCLDRLFVRRGRVVVLLLLALLSHSLELGVLGHLELGAALSLGVVLGILDRMCRHEGGYEVGWVNAMLGEALDHTLLYSVSLASSGTHHHYSAPYAGRGVP